MTPEFPPLEPAPPTLLPSPEPPVPPCWSFRDLFLLLGFGAVAFFLAWVTMMLAAVGMMSVRGGPAPGERSAEAALLSIVFMIVLYIFLFAAIYGLVALRGRLPFWRALKWRRLSFGKILGYFAGGLVLAIVVELVPAIFPDKANFPLQELFSSPAVAYALGGFAVLVAPFMEELVFRGVLFSIFEDQVGLRFSILVTAVLFTAMHIPEYMGAWNHIFLLLIVGLVFSLARGLTGSLAPSIFLHTAYNFCQVAILFFATDHFRHLQGVLIR